MGPVGPKGDKGDQGDLTGGTLTGPLYYTATGGTVPRSAQDRAADVANVLDFGADPTGVADSAPAIQAALATARNVWLPCGIYLVRSQLAVGNGQELYGDGRGLTTLSVDQTFNSAATGIISLTGREQFAPCVHDLAIRFAQPQDQSSRANFKTLATGGTSGTGGTGVQYPPAIIITSANRFRLYRLRITCAWSGIINAAGNSIGGFTIRDTEMCAFNTGLSLDNCFDFGHISGWHFWTFDLSPSLYSVYMDGLTFAARFGVSATAEGMSCTDWTVANARVSIDNSDSWLEFSGLMMDGDNATLEVKACQFTQISGVYFSGSSAGSNPNPAQMNISGGNTLVSNLWMNSSHTNINVTGGALRVCGGEIIQSTPSASAATVSGGALELRDLALVANTGAGAWTVPFVNVTGGTIFFQNNRFASASVGDVGGLVIANDNNQHAVSNNFWNGWGFTSPGPLGAYGWSANGVINKQAYMLGGATFGSPTGGGVSLFVVSAAGTNRNFGYFSGASLRWNAGVTGTPESVGNVGSDYQIQRYDDSGAFIDTPFSIVRSSGITSVGSFHVNNALTVFGSAFLQVGGTIGTATANGVTLALQTAAGSARNLTFNSGATNSLRWNLGVSGTAEGGSNSGSDFQLQRFSDTAGLIDTPISIARSSGTVAVTRLYVTSVFGMNAGPTGRQTVTGAKGSNAALGSLIAAMTAFGLITDSTTA